MSLLFTSVWVLCFDRYVRGDENEVSGSDCPSDRHVDVSSN